MNIINNTLNNIVIFLINLLIDILLLRFIREKIRRKKEAQNSSDNAIVLNHDEETKKKVTHLLIVNGVLAVCTRAPSFCVTIWLIVYKKQLSEFCFWYFTCPEFIEMTQSFELVFISLQFFDKNVSTEFIALIKRILRKV